MIKWLHLENLPTCYFQYEYKLLDICFWFIASRWFEIVHHRCLHPAIVCSALCRKRKAVLVVSQMDCMSLNTVSLCIIDS